MSASERHSSARAPNALGISRRPLGSQAPLAQVLCSIVGTAPLDPRAPSLTVCRLADGQYAVCETTAHETLIIGEPLRLQDAVDLAMCVLRGDPDVAGHPYTAHAIATALLAMLAGAALTAQEAQLGEAGGIVVPFPAARGAS
ncbi:hypothetical protein [Hyphomicrobium sp. DY-1]|uniref:hypothetical protein n=1 Tax=Hyphomicrobium sp. DY-1 TaxID=3075650 RepID=UPI0039C19AA5